MLYFWKKIIVSSFILFWIYTCSAQKKKIGVEDLGTWNVILQNMTINNNGTALCYYIGGKPAQGQFTAVLRSVKTNWSKEFINGYALHFTSDNRKFVCALPKNEVVVQYINSEKQYKVSNVGKYSVWSGREGDWLAYIKEPSDSRELVLVNLSKDEDTIVYHQVDDFFVNSNGSLITVLSRMDSARYSLKSLDNKKRLLQEFYNGEKPSSIILSNRGNKIAFLAAANPNGSSKSIWYWRIDSMNAPRIMAPSISAELGLDLVRLNGFDEKYDFVYCTLGDRVRVNDRYLTDPIIYRYNSARLESDQSESNEEHTYGGAWYINENKIVQLQMKGETGIRNSGAKRQLLMYNRGYRGEWNWNESSIPSCILVDMIKGDRMNLTSPGDRNAMSYVLSPKGNRIVYYDADQAAYFRYDIEDGSRHNITPGISTNWTTYDRDDEPFARYVNIGIAGFSADESRVYLYDQYDIFQIDLLGKEAPINLTNGYGKANKVVFRFAFSPNEWYSKTILLTAFSRQTKKNGFFEVKDGDPSSLRMLTMEPCLFTGVDESKYIPRNMPIKAKNAAVFALTKMDASHGPDVCVTNDFQKFKKLSDVHPEKNYNWLTTELVNFKTLDGKESQGILYKPEDFDSTKRYPLVFYYYEKISECLNLFIRPDVSDGPVNIPFLVSNGYLVFTPDVHFEIGYPGKSSYNTVMGAANKLVGFQYVDSTKMAIQGHSFGGFQTNYIVTHTNRFAAACSAAGFTNFVSAYGAVVGDGFSRQGQYELYRDRIGANLWARPDLYLENSPVLRIDKINTPILLMHNRDDKDVPVEQGLEFFTGLRRLGKIAYLLQYKDEGHVLLGKSAMDYSKRIIDFFNFYLKRSELPSWMSNKSANIVDFNYPFREEIVRQNR